MTIQVCSSVLQVTKFRHENYGMCIPVYVHDGINDQTSIVVLEKLKLTVWLSL